MPWKFYSVSSDWCISRIFFLPFFIALSIFLRFKVNFHFFNLFPWKSRSYICVYDTFNGFLKVGILKASGKCKKYMIQIDIEYKNWHNCAHFWCFNASSVIVFESKIHVGAYFDNTILKEIQKQILTYVLILRRSCA